ncbi:hypothetical protein [Anabaena sp. CA = ATCC 33047]|uniref:hypothetical protein n=1 Tax=Anabaena sp. (strain CA / ATCC 33047) TaxID=52271 RepID=UPI000832E7BE|nr:hypothetical protein [Anabaena sp. CA = ATCC 33047]
MELSILALQAVNIALYAIDKATGGVLEKAGADVLDFLKTRFKDRLQIESAKHQPKLLEAAIVSEAESDKEFKEYLERLVTQYNQLQNTSNISQNTASGVNLNVNNNPGTIIGQQIGNQFFR